MSRTSKRAHQTQKHKITKRRVSKIKHVAHKPKAGKVGRAHIRF